MGERKAYEYDYEGSCAPGGVANYQGQLTFSVGVFQWIPKANGVGLKRGRVVRRIRGYVNNPDMVYTQAKKLCEELNSQRLAFSSRRPR
jgi:hypothetical protein